MKILLFGVSNVGKTTIGKLLAEKIKFSFYDLDDEIKKYYGITLEEFVHTENLRWRDQKRGQIINKIRNCSNSLPCKTIQGCYNNSNNDKSRKTLCVSGGVYDNKL